MHFHHRHDVAGCCDHHGDWPDWATTILATLDRMEIQIMSANQDQLDALAAQLSTLAADFAAAQDAAPAEEPLDFTAVNAAVAQLQALAPAAPAPAEPTPDEQAANLAEQAAAPAPDGTVVAASVPSVPLA